MTRKEFVALAKAKGFKRNAKISYAEWFERIATPEEGFGKVVLFKNNSVHIYTRHNLDDITPEFLEAVLSKKGVGK